MREKKLGLFGNAKYSRPVFKNVSNAVTKGVDKDIALLVRHEPLHEVRKWANAPRSSGDSTMETSTISVNTVNQPRCTNYRVGGTMHRAQNAIAQAALPTTRKHTLNPQTNFQAMSAVLPPNNLNNVLKNLTSGSSDLKKQRLDSSLKYCLPATPPFEDIAKNILAACPKITLHDADTAEYSEQVFSLAQSALILQINKTLSVSNRNDENEVNNDVQNLEKTSKDVYKSICDKTAIFDDDSDVFEECDVLDTESPTRIFNHSNLNASNVGAANRSLQFFNMSAFNTQNNSQGSNDSFEFQVHNSSPDDDDMKNAPLSFSSQKKNFKQSNYDKTVSFHFNNEEISDGDFAVRSQEGYSPVQRTGTNSKAYFPEKEDLFLDHLSFNFVNNELPAENDGNS